MAAPIGVLWSCLSLKSSHVSCSFVYKIRLTTIINDIKQVYVSTSYSGKCRFFSQVRKNNCFSSLLSVSRNPMPMCVDELNGKFLGLTFMQYRHSRTPRSCLHVGTRLPSHDESNRATDELTDAEDSIGDEDFRKTSQLLTDRRISFSGGARAERESTGSSEDVVVRGNVRNASDTHRKRVERKAFRETADLSSAAVVAARIRKGMKGGAGEKEQQNEGQEQAGVENEADSSKKKPQTLRHQTQDLSRLQASTVANILRKSVIYDKGDIVAIDKPYGLPCHGGPGVTHNIDSLLPHLAKSLARKEEDNAKLYLVHRLDKETTGVMLLAKTEDMLRRLQAMFRHHKVIKKYWVITVGIPDPPSGVIDMPMTEAEIGDRFRMVVKPDLSSVYPNMKKRKAPATEAITQFTVIDSAKKCALVELKAMTGVKHQIRVHLAQGMACPILGDHKYSHFHKQAPQRLPYNMLVGLGITQPKARTVPMHLHAQSILLPEFFEDGRNLNISTRLPAFFATNMKKLKLKVPSK